MKLQNLIHIVIGIVCIGLLPRAQAVIPPPLGGYPNFTTAAGDNALKSLTSGAANTAIGTYSLFSVTTGSSNTAIGAGTLLLNMGDDNTAAGALALLSNTTGTENTATGKAALEFNSTGNFNTANGAFALFNNTEGGSNVAIGDGTLENNTTGSRNTVGGTFAMFSNVDGFGNDAFGDYALWSNISGVYNTAVGDLALTNNDSTGHGVANFNTAVGAGALSSNVDGSGNVAIGDSAFAGNGGGSFNTVVGQQAGANVEGSDNIYIGATAADGVTNESGTIRIGNPNFVTTCYIAGISGQTASGGVAVFIDANGKLGTVTSSARFKDDIKSMDKASEALLALKPVTFRYKKEIDPTRTSQFGLVAEEVEKVDPDLVVRDKEEKPYTVRYDAVNAMLLNEFLKEHKKVEEQQATIAQLKKDFGATVAQLTARLDEQASQIQRVSAQLEASNPAPQVVNNR
ncbi:MAG: tail fiber domain-containing protein [Candidatus Udaeobacter sp.]